jgi:ABC-type transporter Mla subunit MlaD
MSHMDIRQRGRDGGEGGQCEAGVIALAEVETIVLNIRAQHDEELAALRDRIERLETVAATNRARLDQIEGFVASWSSFSRLLAGEADRLNSP